MSSRGRGNVTVKRGALPNLALAGKREGTAASATNSRGAKRDGRGRGRGRGRGGAGGRGGFQKQALIQSEGIFSEGLSGADPSKRTKEKDSGISFTTSSRRVKIEEDEVDHPYKDPGQGWEEMWESDEETDAAELSELMKDDFISDYRRGTRLPIVLPHHDEGQFIEVLHKSAKEELLSEDEDMEIDDTKPGVTEQTDSLKIEDKSCTALFSRKAGDIFLNSGDSHDVLYLLQLPSVVNVMSSTEKPEEDKPSVVNAEGISIEEEAPVDTVPKLPSGNKVGKLQITKSGRVFLNINGVKIDVAKSTNGGQQEGIICLETSTKTEGSAGGILQVKGVQEGNDSVFFMGNVKYHLSGSLPWVVHPKSKNIIHDINSAPDGTKTENLSDTSKLKQQLANMRKEASSWGSLAENWSSVTVSNPPASGFRESRSQTRKKKA